MAHRPVVLLATPSLPLSWSHKFFDWSFPVDATFQSCGIIDVKTPKVKPVMLIDPLASARAMIWNEALWRMISVNVDSQVLASALKALHGLAI
jgi:hypothetical protein